MVQAHPKIESMLDPCNDRVVKTLTAPPRYPMDSKTLFNADNLPNSALMRQHLLLEGKLNKVCLMSLILKSSELFSKRQTTLRISTYFFV